jgi:hypothetical protein
MAVAKKPVPGKSPPKGVKRPDAPMSETILHKDSTPRTAEECIEILRTLAAANPTKVIGRNWFRVNSPISESVWNGHFGTWHEFKRQAGIVLTRQQHHLEKQIAKHASVDHYRRLGAERAQWGEKYLRDSQGNYKLVLFASDLHDIEIDPFWLRVFVDTAERSQPDVICLVGDIFDLPEFGKYGVDPREWDVCGRIRFVHEKILKPLREACPNAQIDLIEGNHEARLLRHMADGTPALRAVLSDLHGFTVSKLMGLDQFEINYVAKADLAAYTGRDLTDELRNNNRVYYDTLLADHFPDARSQGMSGVNGHHHRYFAWTAFSKVFGPTTWIQQGSGHRRDASYCAGEKWNMGFTLGHVYRGRRASNLEYVTVSDIASTGGKLYVRDASEQGIQPIVVTPGKVTALV